MGTRPVDGRHHRGIPLLFVVLVAAVLLSPGTFNTHVNAPPLDGAHVSNSDAAPSTKAPSVAIFDGQTIRTTAPVASQLRDTVSYGSETGATRTYWIKLAASVALPTVSVTLETSPLFQWGLPVQIPGGADSLPPLSLWNWAAFQNGKNDTAEWSWTAWSQILSLSTTWTNQTLRLTGTATPHATVQVNPAESDGTTTPGIGLVMNTPGVAGSLPTNDSQFESMAAALHPSLVRFSAGTSQIDKPWNTATDQPVFKFTYFDRLVNFTHAVGARVLLSLPAGTWGDGNTLPPGMPLNTSMKVVASSGTGYFPSDTAWARYVEALVNHTIADGAQVKYWTIGNEFPTRTLALVAAYTHTFNIAAKVIHARLPNALVGSDVMMNATFERYFAAHAVDVGFLSFHYYPSVGLCVKNGVYCPPAGHHNGTTDPSLFSRPAYKFMVRYQTPNVAQDEWHNLTGRWIPVFNAEANLAEVGGNAQTGGIGTDPRQQTLFGAAWVVSTLIDGARDNSSDVTYFSLSNGWNVPSTITEPYGGFGFGLTSEGHHGAADVRYAPYYALELWGTSIPAGEHGVYTHSSAPTVIYSYAGKDGPNLSVVLVNRDNISVSARLNLTGGGYTLSSVTTLDQRSYDQVYEKKLDRTVLKLAGTSTSHPALGTPITIDGYGVAVAHFAPVVNSLTRTRDSTSVHDYSTARTVGRVNGGNIPPESMGFSALASVSPSLLTIESALIGAVVVVGATGSVVGVLHSRGRSETRLLSSRPYGTRQDGPPPQP
jgi:hypothetical protein